DAFRFLQRPLDADAFGEEQVVAGVLRGKHSSASGRRGAEPEIFGAEIVAWSDEDGPPQRVLQLAHVARPGMADEALAGFRIQTPDGSGRRWREIAQEALGQGDHVLGT